MLIDYSVRSVKKIGLRWQHFAVWLGFLALGGCTGYMEYLVQRHADWFAPAYSAMAVSLLGMAGLILWLYASLSSRSSGRRKPSGRQRASGRPGEERRGRRTVSEALRSAAAGCCAMLVLSVKKLKSVCPQIR